MKNFPSQSNLRANHNLRMNSKTNDSKISDKRMIRGIDKSYVSQNSMNDNLRLLGKGPNNMDYVLNFP